MGTEARDVESFQRLFSPEISLLKHQDDVESQHIAFDPAKSMYSCPVPSYQDRCDLPQQSIECMSPGIMC